MRKMFVLAASLSMTSPLLFAADPPPVPYPEGYRQWTHVKSMTINPGHPLHAAFGGIHHLYANKKAEMGCTTGKFADSSVIAFDLLEANAAAACYQCHTSQKGGDFVFSKFRK